MIKSMAMEVFTGLMGENMKDNGKMASKMVKEFILQPMEPQNTENGLTVKESDGLKLKIQPKLIEVMMFKLRIDYYIKGFNYYVYNY